MGSTYTFTGTFYGALSETISSIDAVTPSQIIDLVDMIGVNNFTDIIYRQIAELVDTISLTPLMSALDGVVLTEVLGLAPSLLPNQIAQVTAADVVTIIDLLIPGIPASISETVGLAVAENIQHAITIIEELDLLEAMSAQAIYQMAYADTLRLADSLANFFGVDVSETLNLAPDWAGSLLINQSLTDTIGVGEAATANLILRVSAEDSLGLDESHLIQAIYRGDIAEQVEISAAYLSPGGGFTTWAMNTRTGAMTEYDNYEFNSFAKLGDTYVGASSSGLYELVGDDDDGTDIIARIKSGFAQWAGTRFTILKGVYLGVRGEGEFVLRVITGDDKTYNYTVAAKDMKSTRVRMGKGIRSRYVRFELISTGQDFDLESVEFIPLMAERRA